MEIIISRHGKIVNGKEYESEEAALAECNRIADSVHNDGMAAISLTPREAYTIRVCRSMKGEMFVLFESEPHGALIRVTEVHEAGAWLVEQVHRELRRLIERAVIEVPQEIDGAFARLARDEAKNREIVSELRAELERCCDGGTDAATAANDPAAVAIDRADPAVLH
nr:MAG TPA: hypothetical protein [Caudoviricetes sp.]